jgi:tetratricopeptide (TPR) repeat protein
MADNGCASMRSVTRPAVLVLMLVFAAAAPARADDAATAREHYQRGTSYYDLGKYPEAIKEFEAAYEIKNDPALLYNLAQSNRLAGNSEQALHFYRTYLRYVPQAKNRAEIEDRIKQLDQLVAQKNANQTTPPSMVPPPGDNAAPPIQTTPPPPPSETPPVQMQPPPGAPPVVADAIPMNQPAPPMLATMPPAPANNHHKMILAGEITAAAGAALFLIGAAYGAAAVGAANEVNNEAAMGKAFDPSVQQRGKNYQSAETALMIVGGLATAAGAGLFFYGRHLAAHESATFTPMASSSGAGMSLRVIF